MFVHLLKLALHFQRSATTLHGDRGTLGAFCIRTCQILSRCTQPSSNTTDSTSAINHLHLVGLSFKANHRLPNSCCYFSEFSAYVGLNCTATCAKPSQSLLLCPYCKTRTLRPTFSCMALSILTCSSQARCQ